MSIDRCPSVVTNMLVLIENCRQELSTVGRPRCSPKELIVSIKQARPVGCQLMNGVTFEPTTGKPRNASNAGESVPASTTADLKTWVQKNRRRNGTRRGATDCHNTSAVSFFSSAAMSPLSSAFLALLVTACLASG